MRKDERAGYINTDASVQNRDAEMTGFGFGVGGRLGAMLVGGYPQRFDAKSDCLGPVLVPFTSFHSERPADPFPVV